MKRREALISILSIASFSSSAKAFSKSDCDCLDEAGESIVTEEKIARFSPRARVDLLKAVSRGWSSAAGHGLISPLRVQHFMAQIATETGGFRSIDEDLSYSASRLMKVWPSRFSDINLARNYARNPEALADVVYGGRLGNTFAGDGYKYRGSGFIQLTGKHNFATKTKDLGLNPDAVEYPDQIRQPKIGFEVALKYWTAVKANQLADADDVIGVRKKINGGLHGIADTRIWLARAKRVFNVGALSSDESDGVGLEELNAVKDRLVELGLLQISGPEESESPEEVSEALQKFREEKELSYKSLSGLSPKVRIVALYDEDLLYALTDPKDQRSENRDNLK